MQAQIIESNFARGYSPIQYCWPNAREPFFFDEMRLFVNQHPLIRSIVALARAKILQALLDIASENKKKEWQDWKIQSWNWVFSDQSDFRAFCEDAGFAPEIVRYKAKNIMENGLHWRAEAGQGKRYGNR